MGDALHWGMTTTPLTTPTALTAPRPITVDDALELRAVSDATLTPDGKLALFVTGKGYDEKDKRAARTIMAVALDKLDDSANGSPWAYSAGEDIGAADSAPRPAPDGATVAFLSDRSHGLSDDAHAAKTQVYLLPRAGGEARRLTAVGGEIRDLAWSPDGSRLVLLMEEPRSDKERRGDEERGDALDVEERPRYTRLWGVDPTSGATTPLTPPNLQVWDFGLSADGRSAAVVVSDAPYEWSWYDARLAVAALDALDVRTIYTTARQLAGPSLSPDGATVAVTSCTWSDRGYYGGDVLLVPAAGGEARNLTAGRPVSATWAAWEPDGTSLLCCGYEEGELALWRLGADGAPTTLWRAPADSVGGQARFSRAGDTIALLRQDTDAPPDLWTARLTGDTVTDWRRVTRLNPQTEEWARGPVSTLRWDAADGTRIQGLLALPPRDVAGAGRPLPLVVIVHGGPTGLQGHRFTLTLWARLLTARGVAVLLPNPRGSVGWGTSFTEANLGDMGGADFGDIMAGVDRVVADGVADPDRLGIAGWSYGGFMTAWAVTRTNRFKAAVMGAGIADWRSFHGASNIPTWDALFYGDPAERERADPYDPAGPYARYSPITHVARVGAPTLVLHGERDTCVPVGQGYQFFRALRDRGVPAAMTVYPGAGHGPRLRAHVKDVQTRGVAWLCRYMGVG